MKSLFRFTLTLCAAALLFTSCSKKNEEGKMIPKNAMFVGHLNTKTLRQKLPLDEIKQTNWYHEAMAQYQEKLGAKTEAMKKFFENPENTGIDLDGGLIFFVVKNGGTDGEVVVEGKIKNKKDFAEFNKAVNETATAKTDGDLNMLTLMDKSVVAWNDKDFVYAISTNDVRSGFNSAMNEDSTSQNNMAPLVDKSVALTEMCKSLFNLKSDSSLAKNEKFTDLLGDNGDAHAWINSEEIVKNSASMGMLGMLKLDVFLKDNISTYSASFDNGKINIKQKGYAGKEFSDFLQKYSGGSVNADMIKSIPSQDVMGVLAMNFKPEGIKELIKLTGLDGMLNTYTSQMGFNLDDFVKANKGDIMFTLTDLKMKQDSFSFNDENGAPSSTKFSKPDFNILFSVSIGDKPSFQKLMDAGKKLGDQMGADTSVAFGKTDNLLAIGNHQSYINQYLAGNSNKFDFMDKLNGHSIGMYIDIHKILSSLATEKKSDSDDEAIMNESLKLWNNVFYTGGEFKQGAMNGNMEINFVDQGTNSLKQLNHYIDELAKVEMAKKKRMDSHTDSLMIPPAMDTVGHK